MYGLPQKHPAINPNPPSLLKVTTERFPDWAVAIGVPKGFPRFQARVEAWADENFGTEWELREKGDRVWFVSMAAQHREDLVMA